jgi:hypothetical protein
MSTWRIACGAALLAAGLTPSAHADDFTKLTLLTFSGPVEVPGIALAAGTYRFQLADPMGDRRVVKVSDKDGTKTYGMFICMANQRMTPTNTPVVMFKETGAGTPPAVQVWFYPGETYGYEFAYPHEQALRIAKATHQPVLAYTDRTSASSSDADRMTSMKRTEVARIDERDRPISTDEALKDSSERRTPVATPSTTTSARTSAPVATSGSAAATPAPRTARQHLPRTASSLPLLALLSALSLAGALGVRVQRQLSQRRA